MSNEMLKTKRVAIAATTKNKGERACVLLSKEGHARLAKNALKDLYSLVPVYRMVTIHGFKADKSLLATVVAVSGGNSPVTRKFLPEVPVEKAMKIAVMNSDGVISGYRDIITGREIAGKRYEYTDEIVLIKFDIKEGSKEERKAAEKIYKEVVSKGISLEGSTVKIGNQGGEYVEALVATPSNERNKQLLGTTVDNKIAWTRLEEVGGYAISKKLNKQITIADFEKVAKRLGLFATPAIPFARVGNKKYGLMLINTKVLGVHDFKNEVNESLKSVGIDIDNNQFDGICWFSNNFAHEGLKNLGVHVNARQAGMFAFQNRMQGSYSKCLSDTSSKDIMNRIASVLSKKYGNDVKIIGNKDEIGVIVDTNGAKLLDLDYDFNEEGVMVYVLDIAKENKSQTDNQLIYKFMAMNPNATRVVLENLAYRDMSIFNNSFGDFENNIFPSDVNVDKFLMNLAKSNPDTPFSAEVIGDKYIISQIAAEGARRHESAFKRGHVNIESSFLRASFDGSYIISDGKVKNVLGVDNRGCIECYSNDVLDDKAKRIAEIEGNPKLSAENKKALLDQELTAIGIKHPAPGMEEFQAFRFLTENELKARLAGLFRSGQIDDTDMNLLFQYFYFTSYGIIKLAPSNVLKHKLAGMDTDFDGIKVVFEKGLVDIAMEYYGYKQDEIETLTGEEGLTYGGNVPYIDYSKKAVNYLKGYLAEQVSETVCDAEEADDTEEAMLKDFFGSN